MTDPRNDQTTEPDDIDISEYVTEDGLDLDRLHAETRRKPYPFKWGNRWWELPHVQDLPDGIFDAYEDLAALADGDDDKELGADEIDAVRKALRSAFGEQWQQITEVKPIPLATQFRLFNAWMRWCGSEPGEASSSAASSNGTAGPSKRTSRSGASTSAKRSTAARKSGSRRASSSR